MKDSHPRVGGSEEGGPGNDVGSSGCARGSEGVVASETRTDSADGSSRSWQGNPGEGAGSEVGNSADFDGRSAALQPGSWDAAGAEGEGNHGGGQAGSRRAGECNGGGAAEAAGHRKRVHSGWISAYAGPGEVAGRAYWS